MQDLFEEISSDGWHRLELFGALRGVRDPVLSSTGYAYGVRIGVLLAVAAFFLGRRHLSWLRGQKEPLPALKAGLVGALIGAAFHGGSHPDRGSSLRIPAGKHPRLHRCPPVVHLDRAPGDRLDEKSPECATPRRGSGFRHGPDRAGHRDPTHRRQAELHFHAPEARIRSQSIWDNHTRNTSPTCSATEVLLKRRNLKRPNSAARNMRTRVRAFTCSCNKPLRLLVPEGSDLLKSVIGSILAFAAALVILKKSRNRRA